MAFNYFDQDELRRQRMLGDMGPTIESGFRGYPDDQEPAGAALALAPDEQDGPEENEDSNTDTATGPTRTSQAQLSPAQLAFQKAMGQMPNPQDYKPSRGRRVMAAIAGGLAGMRDPTMGYNIGHAIASSPYQAAQTQWQQSLAPLEANMKLENESEKQAVARDRAGSYARSATAREKAAAATEAWRRSQEAHQLTFDQQVQLRKAGLAPQRPTPFQEYQGNPEGYGKFQAGQHPLNPNTLTFEQRQALQESGAAAVARHRRPLQGRAPHISTPAQQITAEKAAVSQILRINPDAKSFINGDGSVKSIDDIMKPGGFMGFGGANPSELSIRRDQYQKFLSQLEQRKRSILGQQASQDWSIQQDDEEDQ